MKALYVGILTPGTTSKMRADTLSRIVSDAQWDRIDTDENFRDVSRLWKSMAFRYRSGPLVARINKTILKQIQGQQYDLVWVDKGVYLHRDIVGKLREKAQRMIHFTPDTAFHANRSRHFIQAIPHYDLLVTTKSFELESYHELADPERVVLATQAYDAGLHKPPDRAPEKREAAVFIGLCEPDREHCIDTLLAAGVPVRLGGRGWRKTVERHSSNPAFHFLGQDVFGADYADEYARASVGLGLLSKRFPELHTTRTFEIPACGALLATEKTRDTEKFFKPDEAFFFANYKTLAADLSELLARPDEIEALSRRGRDRVLAGGYDYASVLSDILRKLPISKK